MTPKKNKLFSSFSQGTPATTTLRVTSKIDPPYRAPYLELFGNSILNEYKEQNAL